MKFTISEKEQKKIWSAGFMGIGAMLISLGARTGECSLEAIADRLIQFVMGCVAFWWSQEIKEEEE